MFAKATLLVLVVLGQVSTQPATKPADTPAKRSAKCLACRGTEKIGCLDCRSTGKGKCPTCGGTGKSTCPGCKGNWGTKCSYCAGRGYTASRVYGRKAGIAMSEAARNRCYRCAGTGYTRSGYTAMQPGPCPQCKDQTLTFRGKIRCPDCRGLGRSGTCPACNGDKTVTCPACKEEQAPPPKVEPPVAVQPSPAEPARPVEPMRPIQPSGTTGAMRPILPPRPVAPPESVLPPSPATGGPLASPESLRRHCRTCPVNPSQLADWDNLTSLQKNEKLAAYQAAQAEWARQNVPLANTSVTWVLRIEDIRASGGEFQVACLSDRDIRVQAPQPESERQKLLKFKRDDRVEVTGFVASANAGADHVFRIVLRDATVAPWSPPAVADSPGAMVNQGPAPTVTEEPEPQIQPAPKVIYLLADGDFTDNQKVLEFIRRLNADKSIVIHTILFANRIPQAEKLFQDIAGENKGVYKFVRADTRRPIFQQVSSEDICFLVDRSGSMMDTFDSVRVQLFEAVSRLRDSHNFHVIFFNEMMVESSARLTPATQENKLALASFLDDVKPQGRSNPIAALTRAFGVLRAGKPR